MNNRYLITIEIEPKENNDLFEEFRAKWQNKGFILKEEYDRCSECHDAYDKGLENFNLKGVYAVTPISNNKFISNDAIAQHFKHIQDEIQKHSM